jgi:hypothetical protein
MTHQLAGMTDQLHTAPQLPSLAWGVLPQQCPCVRQTEQGGASGQVMPTARSCPLPGHAHCQVMPTWW